MPRVLIASDKFKGSLTGTEVATAVATGVRRARPDVLVDTVPVADGGDGTLAAAEAAGFTLVGVTATGPTGAEVRTSYARRDGLAVVELAAVSGLACLPDGVPAPMTATSRGTGEVIAAAVDAGCRRVLLGIGGSASTDGGLGLVRGLGARALDADGREVAEGGLDAVRTLDLSRVRARMAGVALTVACDVDNPLTGLRGAAAVYGPQKGADPEQVRVLDRALAHWADVVGRTTGQDHRTVPGAGAAGGVGFAAVSLLGAELRSGIALVLELTGFAALLAGVDLVITGEGSLDEQTLHGKVVTGVAAAAGAAGVPVVAVCGRTTLGPDRLGEAGVAAAYALTDLEPDVRRCMSRPVPLLQRLGERIAADRLVAVPLGGGSA
jgi:glycerate 2-kinase